MRPISDLTYKIISYPEISDYSTDEFVDWGLEMVFLGHESTYLYMLAGLVKPTYSFQAEEYLERTLTELKLKRKKGRDALISYSSYFIKRIAQGEDVSDNLHQVFKLYMATEHDDVIFDFVLQQWAWDDFNWENETSHYWPSATMENIESIVVETAKTWLENHKHAFELVIGEQAGETKLF